MTWPHALAKISVAIALAVFVNAAFSNAVFAADSATAEDQIRLDIRVIDAAGEAVSNLGADDLIATVDGQPATVSRLDPAAAPAAHWLLMVDLPTSHPGQRRRLLPEIQTFLSQRQSAGEPVTVVIRDRQLDIPCRFSLDLQTLDAAFDLLARNKGMAYVEARRSGFATEMHYASGHLERLLLLLAGVDRPTQVLYFGAGMLAEPSRESAFGVAVQEVTTPAPIYFYDDNTSADEGLPQVQYLTSLPRSSRQLDRQIAADDLMRAAAGARVSLYPASSAPLLADRWRSGSPPAADGPGRLAADTGGWQLPESELGPNLAQLGQRLDRAYRLVLGAPAGNEFRRLELTAKDPSLEVDHSANFRALNAEQRLAATSAAAIELAGLDNPLRIEAEVGAARNSRGKRATIPILLTMPAELLAPTRVGSTLEGRFFIQVLTRDEQRGDVTPLQPMEVPFAVPADATRIAYPIEIPTRRGLQTVAVAIRAESRSEISALSLQVDIP